ncbi:Lrp/AsnC family transcriptional regulator [Glaciecola sp. XM2]|jgi:DNA-binding Lrp family transcriptional regulator|uniref:Lrp/AsnC family transcriptional regulator n=1 Tax=Glaciecola sp. XM2 TaxID=1914931 RepID=UPI001BDE2689|nr:Lrp/AsnC family transcriptional regulator [Glaciecola sp. XM2]MBT1450366.1 Lrp/AsnC family transcriptional regulator [Glaciecola sp. XM2]
MDKIDRKILRELQINGRITNQELADKINLSPSPCLRRVKQLETKGIIKGYTLDVDYEAYGLPITVFVSIQLERHSAQVVTEFENAIKLAEQVLECFVMTGRSDYLLKVVVKDLHDYEHFVRKHLHAMGNIASIDTSFAYGTVKRSHVLPQLDR